MSLRSGRKNKLSRIKQLFALDTLQIAPKPRKKTKPQPLHYTLNTKVAGARHSIASLLCLQVAAWCVPDPERMICVYELSCQVQLVTVEAAQLTRAHTEQHRTVAKRNWSCYEEEEGLPTTFCTSFQAHAQLQAGQSIVNGLFLNTLRDDFLMALRNRFFNRCRHTGSTGHRARVRLQVVCSVQELPVVLLHGVHSSSGNDETRVVGHDVAISQFNYHNKNYYEYLHTDAFPAGAYPTE